MLARTFPLLLLLLARLSFGQLPLPWDGPLAPVDDGRMIVAATCVRGEKLSWSTKLRRQAHGMEPGERVWLLTRTGAARTRLGEPTCYAGECRGDYAALQLPVEVSSAALAVVPLRFLREGDQVRPLRSIEKKQATCARRATRGWQSGQCKAFDLEGLGRHLEVLTETRPTESGWDLIRTYARVATPDGENDWRFISETTGSLDPEALVVRSSSLLILWRQRIGIGGPHEITLVLSRVEPDGSLTFGRRYTAGGQPCD